jgi:hypothetical protein
MVSGGTGSGLKLDSTLGNLIRNKIYLANPLNY